MEAIQKIQLWMPITKAHDGGFVGILSDTSMDRDGEFMSKELLETWAKTKTLPALLNHENKMEKFVGAWKNLKVIKKGRNHALVATPTFFSKEASPIAAQMEKLLTEAVEMGLNPGISIGAIVHDSEEREVDGEKHKVFTRAELVEATLVPIQSNRNASFGHIAKQFDFEIEKTVRVTTRQEKEVITMSEEPKAPAEPASEPEAEPAVEPAPAAEPAPESAKAINTDILKKIEALEAQNAKMSEELQKVNKRAIIAPTVEGPGAMAAMKKSVSSDSLPTIPNMLKAASGMLGK